MSAYSYIAKKLEQDYNVTALHVDKRTIRTISQIQLQDIYAAITSQATHIAGLEAKLKDSQATIERLSKRTWDAVYPDDPDGWAYPDQAINHLIAQRDELRAVMAAAKKVLSAFPDKAPCEFNIPAYIIDDLREKIAQQEDKK